MEINIKINDRLYNQLCEFCKINELELEQYIVDIIERGFAVDRFGDMNVLKGLKTLDKVIIEEENTEKFISNIKDTTIDNTGQIVITTKDNDKVIFDSDNIVDSSTKEDTTDTTVAIEKPKNKTKTHRQLKSK